ncbi:hypothetical protein ACU4GD_28885 [Cupriavidus basilensis]
MFLVPDELLYMYTRARQKGENSITWGRHMLGSAFNIRPIVHMHRGQTEPVAKARVPMPTRHAPRDGACGALHSQRAIAEPGGGASAMRGLQRRCRGLPAFQSLARTAQRARCGTDAGADRA